MYTFWAVRKVDKGVGMATGGVGVVTKEGVWGSVLGLEGVGDGGWARLGRQNG